MWEENVCYLLEMFVLLRTLSGCRSSCKFLYFRKLIETKKHPQWSEKLVGNIFLLNA